MNNYWKEHYYKNLNAKSEDDFAEKLLLLKNNLKQGLQGLKSIKTIDDFYEFFFDFLRKNPFEAPFVKWEDADRQISSEAFSKLTKLNYPKDFLEWYSKYSHCNLYLGYIKILSADDVFNTVNENDLLKENDIYVMAKDVGGNLYCYDVSGNEPKIKYFDHVTSHTYAESLDQMYEDYYDFWYNEDDNKYNNPKKLDITQIHNSSGEFLPNSIYIKQYLDKCKEGIKVTKHKTFLDLLNSKTKYGFKLILDNIK